MTPLEEYKKFKARVKKLEEDFYIIKNYPELTILLDNTFESFENMVLQDEETK